MQSPAQRSEATEGDAVVGLSAGLLERAEKQQNAVRMERERVHLNGAKTTFHHQGITLEVENLAPTIGSVIKGVKMGDVAKEPKLLAAIKALLHLRKVIFFRDQQDVTRADHVAFG